MFKLLSVFFCILFFFIGYFTSQFLQDDPSKEPQEIHSKAPNSSSERFIMVKQDKGNLSCPPASKARTIIINKLEVI